MSGKLAYIVAGSALVGSGVAILALANRHAQAGTNPIEEAQRMLSRAQTKINEIETGLREKGRLAGEPA